MDDRTPVEMDGDERNEFLGTGGVGVMSFSTAGSDPPRSIPVSYGYDAAETTFYFRLAVGPDYGKGDLDDRLVSFVVHGTGDAGWRSVVASGRLEEVSRDGIATQTLEGLERVHIPLVDVFGVPPRSVSFEFVRLVPDQLTGRKEARTGV